MNHESSLGVILLTALLHFTLLLPFAYHLFMHLLSTNHKCTQPCYFSPATQTHCSKGEDGLELFDEEFQAMRCPDCHFCSVMESSAVPFCKRVTLVF
jgi:hypothetical protein